MELKDVKVILNRIKVNYPTFVNDDYTRTEWYRELKDYSLDDVMEKLEQHFRSEQYGNQIPKVYFLTKYLTKEKDKTKKTEGSTQCNICHKFINIEEYETHFDRCSSVDYLNRRNIQYFDKPIDKEKYMTMEQREFDEKYNKMCYYIYEHTQNQMEKYCLNQYLMGLHKSQENLDI